LGPNQRLLPCERKHRHLLTRRNASIPPLTMAFAVVACRLVLSDCKGYAACSPPVGLARGHPGLKSDDLTFTRPVPTSRAAAAPSPGGCPVAGASHDRTGAALDRPAGRLRSEAALAALAGANPIPASSGQVTRHRLNRSGDRQLNSSSSLNATTERRSKSSVHSTWSHQCSLQLRC
jgi:hypothetical protein